MVSIALLLACAGPLSAGNKTKLQWYTFEKGLAEAKKANKKMLVDVYTDWCGWCKKMDADTYSNSEVAAYLQEKYILVKLNAESSVRESYQGRQFTEQELAGEFGVSGYPTTLFFAPDGSAITAVPGYANASDFKIVLSYIAEDHYKTTKFEDYAKAKK